MDKRANRPALATREPQKIWSVEASDKATTAATIPCVRQTTDENRLIGRATLEGSIFPEGSVISGDNFVKRSAQPFRFVN